MEVKEDFDRELKKRKQALVLSGRELDAEGLDSTAKMVGLLWCADGSMVINGISSVHRRRTGEGRYVSFDEESDWKHLAGSARSRRSKQCVLWSLWVS